MEKRKVAKVSRFQAVSQKSKRDAGLSTIITAKKSFVEAKSICPGCGIRVNRNEMGPCDNCGIQIYRIGTGLWQWAESYLQFRL